MDLLPQVGAEYLDQGDLQGWDLAVHENARQIQLHLKRERSFDRGAGAGRHEGCTERARRAPRLKRKGSFQFVLHSIHELAVLRPWHK